MSKVEDVRLECADNGGFIVCYTEKVKPSGSGDLSSYQFNYKKESYGPGEGMKAIARMSELAGVLSEKEPETENKLEM